MSFEDDRERFRTAYHGDCAGLGRWKMVNHFARQAWLAQQRGDTEGEARNRAAQARAVTHSFSKGPPVPINRSARELVPVDLETLEPVVATADTPPSPPGSKE